MASGLLVMQSRFEMVICSSRYWHRRIARRRADKAVRGMGAIGIVGMVLRPKPVAARSHRLMCCMRIVFTHLVVPRSFDMTRGRLRMVARCSRMLEGG
ncbi:MAG: hypothetical protein ACK5XB_04020 [Rhodospirillales bacterium]|jgi:hypothetical protein